MHVQDIAQATALVAIREAAFLLVHYSPSVALASLNASCGDLAPVLRACSRTKAALERHCALHQRADSRAKPQAATHHDSLTARLHHATQPRANALAGAAAARDGGHEGVWPAAVAAVARAQRVAADAQRRNVSPAATACVLVVAQQDAVEAAFGALASVGGVRQLDSARLCGPDAAAPTPAEVQQPHRTVRHIVLRNTSSCRFERAATSEVAM